MPEHNAPIKKARAVCHARSKRSLNVPCPSNASTIATIIAAKTEQGNSPILTIQESHRAFEDGVRDFLHGRGACIFAQHVCCKVGGEAYREKPYHDWNKDIVTHVK